MKFLTALKHLLKPLKYKGSFGGSDDQKIKYMLPALITPEIRNITQNEKPSEE